MILTEAFVKNMQRFRLVTFDITDTLLRFRKAPAVQYAKTAAELGILENIDQQRLNDCFRREFKRLEMKHPNFGRSTPNLSWQQWWITLVENIFQCLETKPPIPPAELRRLAETLLVQYRTRECWTHIAGGVDIIRKVKKTGKCVGVISNFDPSLTTVLHEMEIDNLFDFVLTSYESEAKKPDAQIFNRALTYCNAQPEEALHIGNIYDIDYLGARNSGWSSLLVMKDPKDIDCINATHVYKSMPDMLKALETTSIEW